MTDYALALAELDVAAPAALLAVPSIPVPTLPGAATTWEVWASNHVGTKIVQYPSAKVQRITWTLDAPAMCEFDLPIDAADIDQLLLPDASHDPAEVKVYRNGFLIFWGPLVTRRITGKERIWHYVAYDPLWYLLHRKMGEAERHNYLTPSSFDSSTDGFAAAGSVSGSIDNARYLIGGGSLDMTCGSIGENFYRKTFVISSGSIGLALFLTAWYYIDSFTAPAYAKRGAFLGRSGATDGIPYGFSVVDEQTPLGTWVPMSTFVWMPPNRTETIDARLYCPNGEVHVDGVTVTIEESLSFINENSAGGAGWDQVQIAQLTARYLAGGHATGNPYRKSHVHLALAGALSGVKKERTYQFFDHQPGYEGGTGNGALDEWCRAENGFDFRIDNDSETVRTFRTYFPEVGVAWDTAMLTGTAPDAHSAFEFQREIVGDDITGSYWGIVDYDWSETIEGAANDIAETAGFGTQGAGREEGSFFDADVFGGLTLELVEAAPDTAPLDALDAIAKQRGVQLGKTQKLPTLTMVEPKGPDGTVYVPLIGVLMPGDRIPVIINDSSVLCFAGTRVTQVVLNAPVETLSTSIVIS